METSNWSIVIAERGWVYVGRATREADMLVLRDCYNIRRWGTSKGLGELALEGPKANTELDHYGTVKIHVLAVIGNVEANDAVWNGWLEKQGTVKRSSKK